MSERWPSDSVFWAFTLLGSLLVVPLGLELAIRLVDPCGSLSEYVESSFVAGGLLHLRYAQPRSNVLRADLLVRQLQIQALRRAPLSLDGQLDAWGSSFILDLEGGRLISLGEDGAPGGQCAATDLEYPFTLEVRGSP